MNNDEIKWMVISLIYFINCGLIVLSWVFGGVHHWPKVQISRFLLLGSLMAYTIYGPIGSIRDGNQFSDRHWVLMNIGIAGMVILVWSAYSEKKAAIHRKDLETRRLSKKGG